MITVVRYRPGPVDPQQLCGAPLTDCVRVVYTLSKAQVRCRLAQALSSGVDGVFPSDLVEVEAGHLREAVLGKLFEAEDLARAYLGLEEDARRTFCGKKE